jgi:hypothetical protein
VPPQATFYIWLDLEALGAPLHDGLTFFEELLKEKCIVVPGIFFDVNPSHRRNLLDSPCRHFVRLSFGPSMDVLDRGLDAIERVVKKHREGGTSGTGWVRAGWGAGSGDRQRYFRAEAGGRRGARYFERGGYRWRVDDAGV